MALKLIVDNLDAIPETLRTEYTEKEGKFYLNVDGAEDTENLKSRLSAANKEATERRKALEAWKALGKTPEELAALVGEQEESARKKAEAEGDFTKVLAQHKGAWDKEKAALEAELTAARSSERGAIIENSIMAALAKAGATEEGSDLLPDRLAARIKFDTTDGKRVVRILSADGETPMAGGGKDGLATFDDLVKEASAKFPSLFKGSGAGGGGTPPNKQATGGAGTARKSDLKSEKDKGDFVDKHGLAAYQALPA